MLLERIKDRLGNAFGRLQEILAINKRQYREATPQKNPSKKGGRGYTKALHNEARAKMRRKLAAKSRKINR